jgi:SAM-dependent methyltransferase
MQGTKCLAGFKCSEKQDVTRALQLLQPSESSLFIDIGSGEGQVLLHAAEVASCRCLGLENDKSLVAAATKAMSAAPISISSRITILDTDAENFNYKDQNDIVVYMFLSHFGYAVMGDVLLTQCPLNTRIVTVSNPIDHPLWVPKCVWLGNEEAGHNGLMTLYLYIVDENVRQSYSRNKIDLDVQPSKTKSSIQDIWIHPPPGSYMPRPIPANTPHFSTSMKAEDIQNFLHLHGSDAIEAANRLLPKGQSATEKQRLSTNVSTTAQMRAVAQPPLPPPLPSLFHQST